MPPLRSPYSPVAIESESEQLHEAMRLLRDIRREVPRTGNARYHIDDVLQILVRLQHNAGHGLHRNPPLTIFANPPKIKKRYEPYRDGKQAITVERNGQIGEGVHLIRYTHADDGVDYEHVFETEDVQAIAVTFGGRRAVLLVGSEDIWDDY